MKKRTLISLFLCIAICFSFLSCGTKLDQYSSHSFAYFDTVTTVTGYAKSKEEFDLVCEDIFGKLSEYHRLFTIYDRYEGLENLCTVNEWQDGAHRTVKVEARIMDMLLFSKEMYRKTNGKVNIAMGSVLSIWHDYREAGLDEPQVAELPPMEKLGEAALHTDINDLILDEENDTVMLADPAMTLDVGAIAKGYAVEMTARSLEEKGISGYVINVGGNVRTVGTKANGEKWTAGIENPEDDGDMPYLEYLYLAGESVVTSGSYQRYYTVDGKDYHHIIDPETLMPAENYRSVSVVCNDSGLGDALSTALFCMDFEEGLRLVESLSDVEAMWVLTDGTKKTSSGFSVYTQK
ncbi:MAG: FAD:protein FMN transferase [Clostridia bacterium]|nr:FAD:protein FMN transferase [Clostridia bacterium]